MSFQSELESALSSVAGGRVYPQAAAPDADLPYVVYRVLSESPLAMLAGEEGSVNYLVAFDCYASSYEEAITLKGQVVTALSGSSLQCYRESSPGEEYALDMNEFMEPTYFGFWH